MINNQNQQLIPIRDLNLNQSLTEVQWMKKMSLTSNFVILKPIGKEAKTYTRASSCDRKLKNGTNLNKTTVTWDTTRWNRSLFWDIHIKLLMASPKKFHYALTPVRCGPRFRSNFMVLMTWELLYQFISSCWKLWAVSLCFAPFWAFLCIISSPVVICINRQLLNIRCTWVRWLWVILEKVQLCVNKPTCVCMTPLLFGARLELTLSVFKSSGCKRKMH